ncbi:MAG TPA: DUF4142 domain-containing protein [Gemmataceae bacterium]|jgi:putative membrane protein|nr:DUF4142 domain-containing protein [Gemmataceae bacterium]
MRRLSFLALAVLGVTAGGLLAQPHQHVTSDDEKFSDKMFVEKAAIGGMFEVKSSQLAQQMAGSTAVKQFAARMITDHTKANQELMGLARQKGWRVPTGLDQKHQEMLTQLQRGEGGGSGVASDRFDRAYIDIQVRAHDKTVALFEKAAQQSQDADLKAWAAKTLPTLKEHQEMARQLSARGNPARGTTTTNPPTGGTTTTPPAGRTTQPTPPR